MSLSLKNALHTQDRDKLTQLLKEQPELSNSLIHWGDHQENSSTPLHYLTDLFAQKKMTGQQAIALAEILLHYDADVNEPHPITKDTPLIAASNVGAENYALWLLSAEANHDTTGLFGATALHWAALMGQDRLLEALLHFQADIMLRDDTNRGTPLDWAIYGWKTENIVAKTNRQPICAAFLVGVGSPVTGAMIAHLDAEEDALMLAILEPEIIEDKKEK